MRPWIKPLLTLLSRGLLARLEAVGRLGGNNTRW